MENKRNVRRKNRKIKFSEERYVEKNYIQGKNAIIPVQLDKISDLYMKHDYKQMELSDSVCKYIEEIAYMIPINTDIIIEIHCPKVDEEMQKRMAKAIKNNYGIEIDDIDYDIDRENKITIVLFIIGLLLLILNILTEKFLGDIISNIICVIWWVAIWYVGEIQMLDKNENKYKRLNYQQLYDAKITFVFEEDKNTKFEYLK